MSSTAEEHEALTLAQLLQTDGLPGVFCTPLRPWRDIADEALAHLVAAQTEARTTIYVRHGELVRIVRKEDGSPSIEALTEPALKDLLARSMNFVRMGTRGPMHIAPPDSIVKNLLSRSSWPFAALEAIVEFPVFRPDGMLLDRSGYDQATRLYYAPTPGLVIPPIPEHPTDEEIVDALCLIDEALGEFPYQDTASHANAFGLLLTPLIRQSISGHVPIALLDAPRPGTGKSLLAETVAMIATGRKAAMIAAPYDDDNEWRKRIASTLADGATIIVIDNVHGRLQSAALDLALTSHTMQERILGQSKNGLYAQRATWIATGNNIQLGGDMPRRSYWIRMDAHTAKPWQRGGFTHNLEEWVPVHRGPLIAALKSASLENTGIGADLFHALPDDLSDIQKGDFRRKLGKALSSRVGSQFDESGMHLVKASTDRRSGSTYWKVADMQISQI